MKKSSYLLRIDDVCPTMNRGAFLRIQRECDRLNIKPIIGIIPDNQDRKLNREPAWKEFWPLMRSLASNNWIIAQHGYQHIYNNDKTEFAGLPYHEQFKKIQRGRNILTEKLASTPRWFMAPAHSLDRTTCRALQALSFSHITDGIALYPFVKDGLIWVPQQLWRPISMPIGLWTICIHPNTMTGMEIDSLLHFLRAHVLQFQNILFAPQKSLLTTPLRVIWNAALLIKRL